MSEKNIPSCGFSAKKQKIKQKLLSAGIGVGGIALITGGARAEINTTAITDMVSSMTTIFPALGDMVVAIVPTILLLAVVGFVTGFFDKILTMVGSMLRF